MVLAKQIEVERCLEANRNGAAILRGLERKQISKVHFASGEKERSGIFIIINLLDSFPTIQIGSRRSTLIFWRQRSLFNPQESFLMSEYVLGPKQSHPTFTTAPFLVQHFACRIWECEKRVTQVQPLLLWSAFSIRAFPPFLKLLQAGSCQMWYCLRAQCDMKSGK